MALILPRVMRRNLRAAHSLLFPERPLPLLRRIQHHRIALDRTQRASGISSISQKQTYILAAPAIPKPNSTGQLTLL